MAGRNLEDAVEQRARWRSAKFEGAIDGLRIPARRHASSKQCFDFRGKIERPIVPGVEQRLDAEAIPRGKDGPVPLIPEHKGKLAAQSVQALHAEIFVKMQGNLAVRSRAQAVTGLLELALDRLEAVEFAVDDDPRLFVFAGDRLIPGREIDDAEPAVAQRNAAVR
jgi:hypothetical protein